MATATTATRQNYDFNLKEFEALLADTGRTTNASLDEGAIVSGKVIELQPGRVIVDVGYKAEGAVAIQEFTPNKEGEYNVKIGDVLDVYVDRVEDDWGIVILSKEKADRLKKWDEIEAVAKGTGIIMGTVAAKVKGGLSVDIGVRAFLPGSQVEIRPSRALEDYIGESYEFKIIKLNRFRNNIVLSRRALLEEERAVKREEILGQLNVGDIVTGVVKNVTEYGAFIDLGGIDGLLHITDMSWGRLSHPSEILQVGQDLDVMVLSFERERERVSLGLKQKTPDPWTQVDKKYPQGTIVKGKVVSIADYGVFVELEEGVEGLVHVSEMSWTERNIHPSDVVKVGDQVDVRVQTVDLENRRIGLSIRETTPNPWIEAAENFPPGTVLEGEVKNVTDFGIFVGVTEGIDGLIHISDIAWVKDFTHPSQKFKEGDTVRAVVTNVDIENERFSLSIKNLQENPWQKIAEKMPSGTKFSGKIVSKTEFGVFISVQPGIEGLLHRSEIPGEDMDAFTPGEEVEVRMLKVSANDQKISLTMRNLTPEEIERAESNVQSELERQLKEKVLKQD